MLVPLWSLLAYALLCQFLQHQTSEAVEKFSVIGPDQPLIAIIGEDAILPCHLSPAVSAEDMEVRWFRYKFHNVVHLYQNGKDENDRQLPDYQGRTEFMKRNISHGSVALRIRRLRLSDEGQYRCFFDNKTVYEEAVLELKVAGLGSAPHIHIAGHEEGGVRVVCNSTGWFPEPELRWKEDDGQQAAPFSKMVYAEGDGLFRIETSLVLRMSQHGKLSCSIRNPLTGHEKEAAVSVSDLFFPRVSPWMVSLFVFLVLLLLLVGFALWYIRKRHKEKENLIKGMDIKIGLLSLEVEWRKVSKYRVNITLDPETSYPGLIVSSDRKTVRPGDPRQDNPITTQQFDTEPCILSSEGFTSGRHYWEVEVHEESGIFWSLGLAKESLQRAGGFRESPEKGIWALRSAKDQYVALTTPGTPLPVMERLRHLGVYLDYEGGRLSFYNSETMEHLYTFTISFEEKVLAYFYIGPGIKIVLSP
ncbi:butyrophilin subfamily 1 member A1 isoform X2 [Microcaecilia unicolor]|nr:butyrophilin subfamily 1 member A1-like isoform X2 [Microcaecilia unicolor]XP_030053336.1 butyrophilin subfamily 1 member A1-like isoform X2 [Microcaecilia unicolor]XP_030053337.1 butyrophilin subfamily 1 member A1-like isoform X2 [Microcaecilia unicolor]